MNWGKLNTLCRDQWDKWPSSQDCYLLFEQELSPEYKVMDLLHLEQQFYYELMLNQVIFLRRSVRMWLNKMDKLPWLPWILKTWRSDVTRDKALGAPARGLAEWTISSLSDEISNNRHSREMLYLNSHFRALRCFCLPQGHAQLQSVSNIAFPRFTDSAQCWSLPGWIWWWPGIT